MLDALTTTRRKFTNDDAHFLRSVANVLAAAIERKALEDELLRISSEEQRRIGQDLHDGLCQQLAGTEFRLSVLVQQLKSHRAAQAEGASIGALLRDVARHARMLAKGLLPVQLEANGLMSALEEVTANAADLYNIRCTFDCREPVVVEDTTMATHLYYIAQEAVSNAAKHGRAKSIGMDLSKSDEEARLTICDDGSGFSPDRATTEGMGLRIMEYRAGMIGGALSVESAKGTGTRVVCTFKTRQENEHAASKAQARADRR